MHFNAVINWKELIGQACSLSSRFSSPMKHRRILRRPRGDWTEGKKKRKSGKIEGNVVESACTYREGNVVLLETCLQTS